VYIEQALYLGEFEFIFETILDHESRDHMGSFDAKKRHRKSHAWAPLKSAVSPAFCHRFFHQTTSLSNRHAWKHLRIFFKYLNLFIFIINSLVYSPLGVENNS
jgi:hypothetical protein